MPENQQPDTDETAVDTPSTEPGTDADEQAAEAATAAVGDAARAGVMARRRKKFLAAAAGLAAAAVAGTVLTLALPEEKPEPKPYTVAVTYKATGEGKATISYNTGNPDAAGGREQLVELPWTKKLRVSPKSGLAKVSIILDKDGGKAQCAVSVRGRHRQRATAFGNFGRATCSARVPEAPGTR